MKGSKKKNKSLLICLTVILLLALLASGCVLPAPQQASGLPRDLSFRAPTLVPTRLPTSDSHLQVTQPANCQDRLTYVSDITVPDGTVVKPGASIDKRWEVENSGTCTWNNKYHLKVVAGPELGVRPEQALLPARAGTRGTIRIIFTAPQDPGTYRSAWQAYNPDDQPFGDPIYIEIIVK